jgi:hypothetical protein
LPRQPKEPWSKKPIIIEGIIGTAAIIGTAGIIGTAAIIGIDTIIGIRITAPITGAITGIPIIGETPGRRGNLTNTAIERPPRVAGFSIKSSNADIALALKDGLTGTPRESMFGKLVAELL